MVASLIQGPLAKGKKHIMMEMTAEERVAFDWACQQQHQSVAARYARILAHYIARQAVEPDNNIDTSGELAIHHINDWEGQER